MAPSAWSVGCQRAIAMGWRNIQRQRLLKRLFQARCPILPPFMSGREGGLDGSSGVGERCMASFKGMRLFA